MSIEIIRDTVQNSHTVVAQAEVLHQGRVVEQLEVVDGTITENVDSAFRSQLSLTTVVPTRSTNLSPLGYEIRVRRGVRLQGKEYYTTLGVFGISDVEHSISANGENAITLTGFDRARRVSRARLTDYYVINFGTNYAAAIQTLIASRVPGLSYNFAPTTSTTPLLVFDPQSDPWEKAQEMAASIGMEVFFDRAGICVLRPVTDPASSPVVATYDEGDSSTILSVTTLLTDEKTYNHIVVTGEGAGTTAPVLAEATDDSPTSPTYILGPYGDVPNWITSGYILTLAQAREAARAALIRQIGLVEQINFSAIVDPTITVGDVVTLTSATAQIDARYVIQSMTIPLTVEGSMTATTRRRQ